MNGNHGEEDNNEDRYGGGEVRGETTEERVLSFRDKMKRLDRMLASKRC